MIGILIPAAIVDMKKMIIPDKITLSGILIALIFRLFYGEMPFWNYLTAGLVFGGLLLVLAIITNGGMGGGDIKLFTFVGLMLGLMPSLIALILSSFFFVMYGLIRRQRLIPFGPFIALGTVISYLF